MSETSRKSGMSSSRPTKAIFVARLKLRFAARLPDLSLCPALPTIGIFFLDLLIALTHYGNPTIMPSKIKDANAAISAQLLKLESQPECAQSFRNDALEFLAATGIVPIVT